MMFVSSKKYRAAVETMEAWQKEAERLNRRLRDENIAYVNAAEEREELRRKLAESEQRHADLADKHNALLATVEADKAKRSDAVSRGNRTRRLKRLGEA